MLIFFNSNLMDQISKKLLILIKKDKEINLLLKEILYKLEEFQKNLSVINLLLEYIEVDSINLDLIPKINTKIVIICCNLDYNFQQKDISLIIQYCPLKMSKIFEKNQIIYREENSFLNGIMDIPKLIMDFKMGIFDFITFDDFFLDNANAFYIRNKVFDGENNFYLCKRIKDNDFSNSFSLLHENFYDFLIINGLPKELIIRFKNEIINELTYFKMEKLIKKVIECSNSQELINYIFDLYSNEQFFKKFISKLFRNQDWIEISRYKMIINLLMINFVLKKSNNNTKNFLYKTNLSIKNFESLKNFKHVRINFFSSKIIKICSD